MNTTTHTAETPELTLEDVQRQTVGNIQKSPAIISLLYDLDLLPEQLEVKSKDWQRMVILVELLSHRETELTSLKAHAERMAKALEDVLWKLDVIVPGNPPPEAEALAAFRAAHPAAQGGEGS